MTLAFALLVAAVWLYFVTRRFDSDPWWWR